MHVKLFFAGILSLPLVLGCSHPQSTAATNPAGSQSKETGPASDAATQPALEPPRKSSDDPPPTDPSSAKPAEVNPESAAPTPAPGQRPPADRTPARPGEAEKITWEDVNLGMQADVVFRPFMIDNHRVKDLEGKRISIVGYMHAGQSSQRGFKDFILLKNTQCKFGPGGQADHLANVLLKDGTTTTFTPSPVKVEGTLVIEPFQGPDGNTWSIYRLEAAQIR